MEELSIMKISRYILACTVLILVVELVGGECECEVVGSGGVGAVAGGMVVWLWWQC